MNGNVVFEIAKTVEPLIIMPLLPLFSVSRRDATSFLQSYKPPIKESEQARRQEKPLELDASSNITSTSVVVEAGPAHELHPSPKGLVRGYPGKGQY